MKTILINNQNLQMAHWQAPPCVMALCYFDGIHLGHQQVIETAREEANKRGLPLALMSFRPHPINILSDGQRLVPHLTTLSEKEKRLKRLGVNLFYLVDFTLEFAALSPKQFVQDYLFQLGVVHAVAGFDFTYGAKGVAELKQIHQDSDGKITVSKVDCIDYRGEKISSSSIRRRLKSADVHEIPHFLGRYYTVNAFSNGHEIQQLEKTMLPSVGVYEVWLEFSNNRVKTYISIDELGYIQLLKSHIHLPKGIFSIRWLKAYKNILVFPRHILKGG
jgi:riboflavin kinase/FMN adenylyltransferase